MPNYLTNVLILSATPVLYLLLITLVVVLLVLPWLRRTLTTKHSKALTIDGDTRQATGFVAAFLSNYKHIRRSAGAAGLGLAMITLVFAFVHAANTPKANSFDSHAYTDNIVAEQVASQDNEASPVNLDNVAIPENAGLSDEEYDRITSFRDEEQ